MGDRDVGCNKQLGLIYPQIRIRMGPKRFLRAGAHPTAFTRCSLSCFRLTVLFPVRSKCQTLLAAVNTGHRRGRKVKELTYILRLTRHSGARKGLASNGVVGTDLLTMCQNLFAVFWHVRNLRD